MQLNDTDRLIINQLQGEFPVSANPWKTVSQQLGIAEDKLLARIDRLQQQGYISRFGPIYNAQQMGGGLSLAALRAEPEDYTRVASIVNEMDAIAHNYEREHHLNMWFVIATENSDDVYQVIQQIEYKTGCKVYNMPKLEEFYLGLKLEV